MERPALAALLTDTHHTGRAELLGRHPALADIALLLALGLAGLVLHGSLLARRLTSRPALRTIVTAEERRPGGDRRRPADTATAARRAEQKDLLAHAFS